MELYSDNSPVPILFDYMFSITGTILLAFSLLQPPNNTMPYVFIYKNCNSQLLWLQNLVSFLSKWPWMTRKWHNEVMANYIFPLGFSFRTLIRNHCSRSKHNLQRISRIIPTFRISLCYIFVWWTAVRFYLYQSGLFCRIGATYYRKTSSISRTKS